MWCVVQGFIPARSGGRSLRCTPGLAGLTPCLAYCIIHIGELRGTVVWRWFPYQTPTFCQLWLGREKVGSLPVAKQPEVIIVAKFFDLFLMVRHACRISVS